MQRVFWRALASLIFMLAMPQAGKAITSEGNVPWAYGSCHGGADPNTFNPATNIDATAPVYIHSRRIVLRYNRTNRCGWGKITNGSPGDDVWVERSSNRGRTRHGKLGDERISYGRDVHTTAYYQSKVLMRACGKAGGRPEIVCTSWY